MDSAGTQGTDLISVIVEDHRKVEAVFTELEAGVGSARERKDIVDHVIAELVRHSVAEEQYMYPATRTRLPDGDQLADREISEHARTEELMKRLERSVPGDADFEKHLTELISEIRHHVREEETHLLPQLREACSTDELAELGSRVLRSKAVAPTRPHPKAPDRPPANRILDPGVGFIDKIRDTLSGRNI